MPFVATLQRDGYPIIAYQTDTDGRPILDSVLLVAIPPTNKSPMSKVSVQGNFELLRTELLTRERYDPKKANMDVNEANRLRRHLRDQYHINGLEGEL